MSDYEKAQRDLEYLITVEGQSSVAIEKMLDLNKYTRQQQERIRDLEQSLTEVLGLIPLPPINESIPWQVRKASALLGSGLEHNEARQKLEPLR